MSDPLAQYMNDAKTKALFKAITEECTGFDRATVVDVAANLLVNAMRQQCPTRQVAERHFDEVMGRTKSLLLEAHYDSVTGKRKSTFPHTQIIRAFQ